MTLHGQTPLRWHFQSDESVRAVTCFSSLRASLSVRTSVKCVVSVDFFVLKAKAPPKPQTKPQQVDGNRVQERMEGGGGASRRLDTPPHPPSSASFLKKRLMNQSLIGRRASHSFSCWMSLQDADQQMRSSTEDRLSDQLQMLQISICV